jgi:hypothetical protein
MRYTVVWRDSGDDYMFTGVVTDADPNELSTLEWIMLAAEVEYQDWDQEDRIAAMAALLDGYDFLAVIDGVPRYVA